VLFVFCVVGFAQSEAGTPEPNAPTASPAPHESAGGPDVSVALPTPATTSKSALAPAPAPKEWAEVVTRLGGIEEALEKKDGSSILDALIAALAVVVGVIVGGVINARIQNKALANTKRIADEAAANAKLLADSEAAQERELSESRARLEIGGALVTREMEQLAELYGPLHALFGQSNALYRQMNEVLCELEPERFRLKAGTDFDKQEFELLADGEWVPFRTVLHLGMLYGRGLGIEDYFDEIVAIGERIQRIIAEKAGFVRPDDVELLRVFGRYLAHYAILKRLHSEMKARQAGGESTKERPTTLPMKVQESAVFPREIHELVKNGFEAISMDLMEWRKKAEWAKGTA